ESVAARHPEEHGRRIRHVLEAGLGLADLLLDQLARPVPGPAQGATPSSRASGAIAARASALHFCAQPSDRARLSASAAAATSASACAQARCQAPSSPSEKKISPSR